jgi:hypothetical protein
MQSTATVSSNSVPTGWLNEKEGASYKLKWTLTPSTGVQNMTTTLASWQFLQMLNIHLFYDPAIYSKKRKRTGGVARVVACLPSKCEVLSSNSKTRKKKKSISQAPVARTYNSSYSGGRDQEDQSSKPAWANSS